MDEGDTVLHGIADGPVAALLPRRTSVIQRFFYRVCERDKEL